MEKKKQTKRYGDEELSLMKAYFKDNDEMIKAIRKVFLQMPLTAIDTEIIKGSFKDKKEIFTLLRKCFLPELDPEAPTNQLIDLWLTIDIKDKTLEDLEIVFDSRELLIDLLEQQLKGLENIANGVEVDYKIKVKDLTKFKGKSIKEKFTNLMARNTLITHTEIRLQELTVLALQTEETTADIQEKNKKNSAK